jgi:8-amino-7-oxononanoate synthase
LAEFLSNKINQRIKSDSLRSLKNLSGLIDFSSNDYLGFARSTSLKKNIHHFLAQKNDYSIGATGSRLLSGNHLFIEDLEIELTKFYNAEAGLIFNSGYDANVGLLSCIAQRGDTIITDELIHASLIDGARLSHANKYIFKHNDLDSLEEKLINSKGNVFIVTESVFSMDGDQAPLVEIINLAKQYNAHLIIDEAHATGVIGADGKGLVNQLNLEQEIFARVHTFGKAIGCHGGIILGNQLLKTYLINFCRSFIYTTALPYHSLVCIKFAHQELENDTISLSKLRDNINYFKLKSLEILNDAISTDSAIQSIIIPGNKKCKLVSKKMQDFGFDVRAILSPTVSEGKERIRVCLHSFNSKTEIEDLLNHISQLI